MKLSRNKMAFGRNCWQRTFGQHHHLLQNIVKQLNPSPPLTPSQNQTTPMETIHRFALRFVPISLAETTTPIFKRTRIPISSPGILNPKPAFNTYLTSRKSYISAPSPIAKAGWILGLGEKKKSVSLPDIVKAGDPVLHEPARDVELGDIGSERIQRIIDDMVNVMRKAPGVGLAAPQIGIPLRVSFDFQFSFCLKWLKFDLFFLVA